MFLLMERGSYYTNTKSQNVPLLGTFLCKPVANYHSEPQTILRDNYETQEFLRRQVCRFWLQLFRSRDNLLLKTRFEHNQGGIQSLLTISFFLLIAILITQGNFLISIDSHGSMYVDYFFFRINHLWFSLLIILVLKIDVIQRIIKYYKNYRRKWYTFLTQE